MGSFLARAAGACHYNACMFAGIAAKSFDLQWVSHARAIVAGDFPDMAGELESVLLGLSIPIDEIIGSGGGEAKGTQRLRKALNDLGWNKRKFAIKKILDGVERGSQSHEVDHVKVFQPGAIALEIEWNNKDPFFDRDLENFKRLHAEGAISVGVIVTRGRSLQDRIHDMVLGYAEKKKIRSFKDIEARFDLAPTRRQKSEVEKRAQRAEKPIPFHVAWTDQFIADKFGAATTHWAKLMERVARGVGNPCPLLLIGLPASVVALD
jgi:hypothetical protein